MEKEGKNKENNITNAVSEILAKNTLEEFAKAVIWKLAKDVEAVQGAFFRTTEKEGIRYIVFTAGYAYHIPDSQSVVYEFGEGLSGQAAKSGNPITSKNVPEGYIKVVSGLGSATPNSILIYPIKMDEKVLGVIELAGFRDFDKTIQDKIGNVLTEVTPRYVALLNKEKKGNE